MNTLLAPSSCGVTAPMLVFSALLVVRSCASCAAKALVRSSPSFATNCTSALFVSSKRPDKPLLALAKSAAACARSAALVASSCARYTTSLGSCPLLNKPLTFAAFTLAAATLLNPAPFPVNVPVNALFPFVARTAVDEVPVEASGSDPADGVPAPAPVTDLAAARSARSTTMRILAGIAAAAVLMIAVLGVQITRQSRQVDQLTAALDRSAVESAAAIAARTPGARTTEVPNWADGMSLHPAASPTLRADWGLEGRFVVGYFGNLGRVHDAATLLDAARRYEEAQGAQFETYAVQRIRGAILDELRQAVVRAQPQMACGGIDVETGPGANAKRRGRG